MRTDYGPLPCPLTPLQVFSATSCGLIPTRTSLDGVRTTVVSRSLYVFLVLGPSASFSMTEADLPPFPLALAVRRRRCCSIPAEARPRACLPCPSGRRGRLRVLRQATPRHPLLRPELVSLAPHITHCPSQDAFLTVIFQITSSSSCGEFDNSGAMMSVDESLLCSFQILKPAEKKAKYAIGSIGRPVTPPRSKKGGKSK